MPAPFPPFLTTVVGGKPASLVVCIPGTQADTPTGLNWRPLAFEKHPPAIRVCCLCGVEPRATLVLPCSHALCEPCFAATKDKGRVCPLDGHANDQDAMGRLQLPPDQVLRLRAARWNQGCCFVGPVSGLLEHFEEHWAFHGVSCNRQASTPSRET
ncbi:uncharacterized protein LOC115329262 [Ixodes scapularis]|uniref:uncharacterized protein LOC115329262 n=1 Tax=Ixodes scapularis TaxID=6945 RepID=UPI001161BA7A|nr:uncharacterized protein LOC115329262 [Ixodes scapularis]